MREESRKLFREKALERLSSSERLDNTLSLSSPKEWLALLTLGAMATSVLVWAILGEVSTFVPARGILLGRGGAIVDAVSGGVGSLRVIHPAVGEEVEEGAVIAEIVNTEVVELHRTAIALVEERTRALASFRAAGEAEAVARRQNLVRQRRRLGDMEESARASLQAAGGILESYRGLFAEGLIAETDLGQSQRTFDSAQRELFGILRARDDLEFAELQSVNSYEAGLAERETNLIAAQRTVSELAARLDTRKILAPMTGRVVETKASIGAVLQAGAPVLSIRPATTALEALVYVPSADGKRVRPSMEVLVSPSSARKEEYGAIRGRVAEVSVFPASLEGMVATLQSRDLAEAFASEGPPYVSRVALDSDPLTASGLAWTSAKGGSRVVSSGTLVNVEIKVESQAPITLIAPALRELLGR